MSDERLVIVVCAFAVGVLARDIAQDHREASPCRPQSRSAVIDPAPASRPLRESWLLEHPLACREWAKNCPDLGPCTSACLRVGVDDPRSFRIEPERNLQHFAQRMAQPPLILRTRE